MKLSNEQQLRDVVATSNSLIEVLRIFDMEGSTRGSGNYRTLHKYLKAYDISTAHFDPAKSRAVALRKNGAGKKIELDEILAGQHPSYSAGHLKRRLFAAGIKQPVCEECGQGDVWNGRPLTLQLDHINGDHQDHQLENLMILCPNCHTQTPTHSGRNK